MAARGSFALSQPYFDILLYAVQVDSFLYHDAYDPGGLLFRNQVKQLLRPRRGCQKEAYSLGRNLTYSTYGWNLAYSFLYRSEKVL